MDFDAIIIGGGVIGLAVGKYLSEAGYSLCICEKESFIGEHASSRNSQVIHSGIYYPKPSLKSYHCLEGAKKLYAYAKENHIDHMACGKLVIANGNKEIKKLNALVENAKQVNVEVKKPSADEWQIYGIQADEAIFVPSTGWIDTHHYLQSLQKDCENHGNPIICHTNIEAVKRIDQGYIIRLKDKSEMFEISTKIVINAAGLMACEVAKSIHNLNPDFIPTALYAKGHYFSYITKNSAPPFHVYPLPSQIHGQKGLGIHLTIDQQHQINFGPDYEWIDHLDYRFDETIKDRFIAAISTYFPELNPDKLNPSYTGIRSKAKYQNKVLTDFWIWEGKSFGFPGLIQLFGIDSPGLTASLSIGEKVKNLLEN